MIFIIAAFFLVYLVSFTLFKNKVYRRMEDEIMIELLSTLTLSQALIYIVLIALAAKEFLTVKDLVK